MVGRNVRDNPPLVLPQRRESPSMFSRLSQRGFPTPSGRSWSGLLTRCRSSPTRLVAHSWTGPVGLILATLASAVLVLLWWALTKWPLRHVGESAQHTSEQAGPTAFLTLLATGWLDGIAGFLGVGPIRPGLLTISGIVVLAIVTYVYLVRRAGRVLISGCRVSEPATRLFL